MASVFFNELSAYPLCTDINEARTRLSAYADLLLKMKSDMPKIEIRYQYSLHYLEILKGLSIGSVCVMLVKDARKNLCGSDVNKFQYLLISQHDPYIKEDELSECEKLNYNSINVFLNKSDQECILSEGFKAAYFSHSICIGLVSEPYWTNYIHSLVISDEQDNLKRDIAICVSQENHLSTPEYINWAERNSEIELITSTIPIAKKLGQNRNAVGKHHGKEVLYAHALKLIQSPYVDEIITSADFGLPSDKDYIAGIVSENGVVRIMLTWESPKVSMLIKTTGRNIKETQAIAEILRKQFAK